MESITYTSIANYSGGVYIHQFIAANVLDACHIWAQTIFKEGDILRSYRGNFLNDFQCDLEDLPPVPLQDTQNVWGFSVGSGDNFILISIVRMDMTIDESKII